MLLSYSILQLVITTLYFAISLYAAPAQSLAIFGIIGSYGPNALSPWPSVIVDTAFVLNTWASDAFLVRIPCSRCHKILNRGLALSMLRRLDGKQVCISISCVAIPRHRRLFASLAYRQLHTRRSLHHPRSPTHRHLLLVFLRRDEHLRVVHHLRATFDAATRDHSSSRVLSRDVLPQLYVNDARERNVVHGVCDHRVGGVYVEQSARERVLPSVGYDSGMCRVSSPTLMVHWCGD